MPTEPLDRIFVVIAVARPEVLAPLPGALTAARRMAAWAAANGYRVVTVSDYPLDASVPATPAPVTVARLEQALLAAIAEVAADGRPLRRLIVYFAGHGAARDANESYWLLSNWHTVSTEAIKVPSFQRMLRFYHPKQLTLVGDACRVIHRDFIDVVGSAVMRRPDEDAADYEIDQFYAVDAGEEAFMVKARGSADAFCLFTEVLLDALEGDAPDACEPGPGGTQLVTSGSLSGYLKSAVPLMASRYNLSMTPKPYPGFYTDRVYATFTPHQVGGLRVDRGSRDINELSTWRDEHPAERISSYGTIFGMESRRPTRPTSRPQAPPRAVPRVVLREPASEGGRNPAQYQREQERALRATSAAALRDAYAAPESPTHFETDCGLAVLGAPVDALSASRGGDIYHDGQRPDRWFPIAVPRHDDGVGWCDILIQFADGRAAYVCAVRGAIATVQRYASGEMTVIHRATGHLPPADDPVVDLLARFCAGLLDGPDDWAQLAEQLHEQAPVALTTACVAAYLCDAQGDFDAVCKVAAVVAARHGIVPLDVALLCGGRLWQDAAGDLRVDLPATPQRDAVAAAPRWSPAPTPALAGLAVAGRAPWFASGWSAIETADVDRSAAAWRDAAQAVGAPALRARFTLFDAAAAPRLADLIGARLAAPLGAASANADNPAAESGGSACDSF